MQETSELYKELLYTRGHRKEVALDVSGEIYGEDRIVMLNTYSRLFRNNKLEVGGAVAGELRAVLLRPGDIPTAAELKPMYRLRLGDTVSEWVQKGVYYIYTRDPDDEAQTLTITAFDGMLKGDKAWEPDQAIEFPMSMRSAATELAALMGVELDNAEDISDVYAVDYPANGWTQRNVLQFIAAAHGGNFHMTDLGKLRLCVVNTIPEETNWLVDSYGRAITIGGVRILV